MAGASNSERPVEPEAVAWARVAGPGTVTAGQPVRDPAVARVRGPLLLPRLALRCREHRCAIWPPAKHQLLAALGFRSLHLEGDSARSVHRSRAPGNREGQVSIGSGACERSLERRKRRYRPSTVPPPRGLRAPVLRRARHHAPEIRATGSAIRTPLAESVARSWWSASKDLHWVLTSCHPPAVGTTGHASASPNLLRRSHLSVT